MKRIGHKARVMLMGVCVRDRQTERTSRISQDRLVRGKLPRDLNRAESKQPSPVSAHTSYRKDAADTRSVRKADFL